MGERKLFAHELEARLDELLMLSLRQQSAEAVALALEAQPRRVQERLLHWVAVAAQLSTHLGQTLATLAPEHFSGQARRHAAPPAVEHVGMPAHTARDAGATPRGAARSTPSPTDALDDLDDLDAWASGGLSAYDAGGLYAAEQAWRQGIQRQRGMVAFAEMEARLQRYLHALSGRPLTLAVADIAWTDTATLWLPPQCALAADSEGNRRLYLLSAALLWAQTRYGSFAIDPEPELAHWPERPAALAWLAVFEAARLEARLADELPGIARDMALWRGPWPADMAQAAADLARPEATVADSLRHLAALRLAYSGAGAVDAAADASALPEGGAANLAATSNRHAAVAAGALSIHNTHNAVPPAPTFPYLGRLDPAAARRVRAARIARDSATLRRALNLLRGSGGSGPETPDTPAASVGDAPEASQSSADLASLPAEAQAAARSLQQDLGELPPEFAQAAGPGGWQALDGSNAMDDEGAAVAQPDARYDEWDYRRQAFRRDWCALYETDGPEGDPAWVAATRQRHAHLIRSLRRRFEALRGEDKVLRRQLDGEEIDLDAQVEAHADRRSGAEPSPRLFRQRRRDERSLAVMFMVDMSGSTKGWVNDAERESLVLLGEAIEALGDRYAIYGFSGLTRNRCDIFRIKRFDQAYDDAVRRRIAGIDARDYTRMGVAVRHLSGLLAGQETRHKLLVTLSDGRPDDHGDEYRGRYGIEDTRRALLEAREQGIRSYCVTIDRHGADYLPQLYGPAHYTVIDDATQLPLRIAEIYRKLTA